MIRICEFEANQRETERERERARETEREGEEHGNGINDIWCDIIFLTLSLSLSLPGNENEYFSPLVFSSI